MRQDKDSEVVGKETQARSAKEGPHMERAETDRM